ncbi:MAG: hypothetical protein ACK5V3_15530 [Bdellovibrionales bacterium]
MKYLIILLLVSAAGLVGAEDIPALEIGDAKAHNMQIGLGNNVEGQPNLPGSFFGAHVNEDKSGPQDACPHCGVPNVLAAEPVAAEFNGVQPATGTKTEETKSGSGGEQL